jgi:hypothetical protein
MIAMFYVGIPESVDRGHYPLPAQSKWALHCYAQPVSSIRSRRPSTYLGQEPHGGRTIPNYAFGPAIAKRFTPMCILR